MAKRTNRVAVGLAVALFCLAVNPRVFFPIWNGLFGCLLVTSLLCLFWAMWLGRRQIEKRSLLVALISVGMLFIGQTVLAWLFVGIL